MLFPRISCSILLIILAYSTTTLRNLGADDIKKKIMTNQRIYWWMS